MSLSHGRKFLAIPGPTALPDEVLQAMHQQPRDIYDERLNAVTVGLLEDLKRVFRTRTADTFIYIANGHGGWEAALANTLSRGDKVLVLENGTFAVGWGEMAKELGCVVEILPGRSGRAVDPSAVEARLRQDRAGEIKAVLAVQIDTASSTINDVPALRAAIDAAGHPALLFIDGVASIGCVPFEMDAWGVDLALTGSQKGLMTPAGMAFVAAGPRAVEARKTADLVTRYWDWDARRSETHWLKYCGTPPFPQLFGLRKALDMLLEEEGLEAVWARHRHLANATRSAVAHWAAQGGVDFHVSEPAERADAVTTVVAPEGCSESAMRAFALETCGVSLGVSFEGITPADRGFRIAHMGHNNAPSMLGVLGALELSMIALGWPGAHGGVSAAAAALAESATR